MITQLEDKAKDIAFSSGLLEEWLKKEPETVQGHLKTITDGVQYWKDKYFQVLEQHDRLNSKYVNLTASSGKLMQEVQYLKDRNDELLIEQQREFHAPKD